MHSGKALTALVITLFFASRAEAQINLPFSREKQAFARLEEGEWRKAAQLFRQFLDRDSVSVEGTFGLADYFFRSENPRHNLDSARLMADRALILWQAASTEYREKLSRLPIDSGRITTLSHHIELETYRRIRPTYSITSYKRFLSWYPASLFREEIVRLRDSVAFANADARNSSVAFKEFFENYPSSIQAQQARQRYDRLLFEEETRSGTVESLESFVQRYPGNPWCNIAVEKIFRVRTIDGTKASFDNFSARYPDNPNAAVSRAINEFRELTMGSGRWLPFIENNRYGFISIEGRILVDPVFEVLPEDALCPSGESGLVVMPSGLYSRSGSLIHKGSYDHASYLGNGFFLLEKSGSKNLQLVHKSGWEPVSNPVRAAFVAGERFLAVRQNELWGVYGFNGVGILPHVYEEARVFAVTEHNSLLLLRRGSRYYLMFPEEVLPFSSGKGSFRVADEVTELATGRYLLRIGQLQEVVDERLSTVVSPDRQMVKSTPAGIMVTRNGKSGFPDWPGLKGSEFDRIDFMEPWMRTAGAERFKLFDIRDRREMIRSADSIWFDRRFAFARIGDSVKIMTPFRKGVTMGVNDQARFLYAQDSSLYLLVRRRTRLVLYDAASAKELFQGAYSDILPVTRNYFQVKLKDKWGLVNSAGKELLPADYDAMLYQQGWFSLLREGKFGGYMPVENKFLKPVYEANLVVFSPDLLAARKGGLWGFLAKNQKQEKVEFRFETVRPVTDSLALVTEKGLMKLFSVYLRKTVLDGIQEWKPAEGEGHIRFMVNGLYGLCRTDGTLLAKPEYSELYGLTDDQHVLYVGVKELPGGKVSADYINELGLVVRRTRMAKDALDTILCLDW